MKVILLLLYAYLAQQEIYQASADTQLLDGALRRVARQVVEPPGEGEFCVRSDLEPSWISNGKCCKCRKTKVKCKELKDCKPAPEDTTFCYTNQVCGCEKWVCRFQNKIKRFVEFNGGSFGCDAEAA